MKPIFILFAVVVLASCSNTQSMSRSCYHDNARLERELSVCKAVRVGNMLYVSGIAGSGKTDEAIKEAYGELRRTLAIHGLSFDNVVSERIYTEDLDGFLANKAIRAAYYGRLYPVSTWVEVERLQLADHVIEIEVTAVIPKRFKMINFDSW
ncbi:MAG: hypothetical protein K6L81_07195 [Agarilytica sp.]